MQRFDVTIWLRDSEQDDWRLSKSSHATLAEAQERVLSMVNERLPITRETFIYAITSDGTELVGGGGYAWDGTRHADMRTLE